MSFRAHKLLTVFCFDPLAPASSKEHIIAMIEFNPDVSSPGFHTGFFLGGGGGGGGECRCMQRVHVHVTAPARVL